MAQKSHGRGGLNPVLTTNVSIAVIFMGGMIARSAGAHAPGWIRIREDRRRRPRVQSVGQELARHRTAAEAGRREPADDPHVVTVRHAADQRSAVERERHQAGPRLRDGHLGEEWQRLDGVPAIHRDPRCLRLLTNLTRGLTIAAEDDLPVTPLAAVEMARDALAV